MLHHSMLTCCVTLEYFLTSLGFMPVSIHNSYKKDFRGPERENVLLKLLSGKVWITP